MEPNFEIKPSRIAGRGAFATKLILPNQTICMMQGEEISLKEKNRRVMTNLEAEGDPLQIDEETFLDLFETYRIINHSCDPNAFLKGRCELVALREIKKGEEITYDYSLTMWEEEDPSLPPLWTMECRCGAKKCRHLISEFYKLPQSVQHSYLSRKIVPDFIIKKSALISASM